VTYSLPCLRVRERVGRLPKSDRITNKNKGENMSNKKEYMRLIDIETREVVGAGDLTPAAAKRLIKLYQQYGIWVEVA